MAVYCQRLQYDSFNPRQMRLAKVHPEVLFGEEAPLSSSKFENTTHLDCESTSLDFRAQRGNTRVAAISRFDSTRVPNIQQDIPATLWSYS